MRLFISINFNDRVKAQIIEIINRLKPWAIKGRFVKEEHMHLTLEFLGEVEPARLGQVTEVLDSLQGGRFELALAGLGYFSGQGGKIYWLGVQHNEKLFFLQEKLHQLLEEKGFRLDRRKYKPHITLGRELELAEGYDLAALENDIRQIRIEVRSVDLMQSEFVDGRLVHTKLYSRNLG